MFSIVFDATVYKVQTLADGGLRVTLDLPESAIAEAAQLMECKRREVVLSVRLEPKRSQSRKPQPATGRRAG